ncbi:hypothetical protein HNR42_003145 [Deinobacterium chartae]|uniref:Uncharacterized protein n=1 Tax=Deinobacterium chartae TaxID=521158 RepID=A0A841I1W9_9DEIO|nr:hypothetical protein [Deinobacterium chartae]MBB6099687.1 hypothetical protein [Deinobacterium chartae]
MIELFDHKIGEKFQLISDLPVGTIVRVFRSNDKKYFNMVERVFENFSSENSAKYETTLIEYVGQLSSIKIDFPPKINLDLMFEFVAPSTAGQYTSCFNEIAALRQEARRSNGVELHKRTGARQRERFALPSQRVRSARVKAIGFLKSAFALEKKAARENPKREEHGKKPLKVGQASIKRPTVRYDAGSYGIQLLDGKVSPANLQGRMSPGLLRGNCAKAWVPPAGPRVHPWASDATSCASDRAARQPVHCVRNLPVGSSSGSGTVRQPLS